MTESTLPKLQLHFDVNGTIIIQDFNAGKHELGEIITGNLAKSCHVVIKRGKPYWNGDKDWQTWLTRKPLEGQRTLESFVVDDLNLGSVGTKKRQFYADFYKKQLKKHFSKLVTQLKKKAEGVIDHKTNHHILPSFFQLLLHLIETERKFSIFIRTFGGSHRLKLLTDEINAFFNNEHSKFKVVKELSGETLHGHRSVSSDNIGVIYRDNHGSFLAVGSEERPKNAINWCHNFFAANHEGKKVEKKENFGYHVKPEDDLRDGRNYYKDVEIIHDGEEEMFKFLASATENQQTLLLRDDFPWWKANNCESHCGKPLLVDSGDKSLHPILFDDNIESQNLDAKIVDCIDVSSQKKLSFEESNNIYIVHVDTLLALYDDNFFIKKLKICEDNRK